MEEGEGGVDAGPPLFVYHRCPAEMQGSTLFPMNDMPPELSSLKSTAAKKYSWRSEVMDGVVPVIDCLWNDAIHCSPYHPRELFLAQTAAGITPSTNDSFFEIPVESLQQLPTAIYMYECVVNEVPIGLHVTDSSRGVVFLDDPAHTHHPFSTFSMPAGANDYFQDPSQFLSFSPTLLLNISEKGVPAATTNYYHQCATLDCLPLTFFHVPHVLIRGRLSVQGCRVVKWSDVVEDSS
mmetsp:Transcript_3470/g.6283  ORF Transcript_3470/g.6283 Transcript_3470/m.6283 type:complete len:237 (+) Transcript_3470:82-792(+)